MIKIYFAGPDVFRENPQDFFEKITLKCVNYNVEPIIPFDVLSIKSDSIYLQNISLLNQSDLVLANLDLFRGPSIDVGTAFEIGYAKAMNKPVIGYTKYLMTTYKERITQDIIEKFPDYPYVENFGLYDNLMISHSCDFIYDSIDKALHNITQSYKWLLNE